MIKQKNRTGKKKNREREGRKEGKGCESAEILGTLFRCGVWHMEEIKGNPKSQEAYKTSKQV